MLRTGHIRTQRGMRGIAVLLICIIMQPFFAGAQSSSQSFAITVTPPIFQMEIEPGEVWRSAVKVVNSNDYELTVYASLVNFRPEGDRGQVRFFPVLRGGDELKNRTMADWILISNQPFTIPPGQSKNIPFEIRVPKDAEPGGHYAAILIGNKPLGGEEEAGSHMKISSMVSSLLFVRVSGEVREAGRIRSFSTDKLMYQKPEARFSLRFENTGNVHVVPRGDIIVYNMWGKERGRIKVNERKGYGSVLPGTIRDFRYVWKGENNFFEVGRYKAVATVSFGEEERQSAFSQTYFWVVPIKPALYLLGTLLFFIALIVWSIRAYIRRALALEAERAGVNPEAIVTPREQRIIPEPGPGKITAPPVRPQRVAPTARPRPNMKVLAAPLIHGAIDLRHASLRHTGSETPENTARPRTLRDFFKKYRIFFIAVALFAIAGYIALNYFSEVLTPQRPYEARELLPNAVTATSTIVLPR